MEFTDNSFTPSARERLRARRIMAENPEIFGVPDECADCETVNIETEETALEIVCFGRKLSEAAEALCHFKTNCDGATRSSSGKWLECGVRITPAG